MDRFRHDNTDGYDSEDLATLNAAWDSLAISVADETDYAVANTQQHIAEQLLFHFDQGKRRDALVAWYYEPG